MSGGIYEFEGRQLYGDGREVNPSETQSVSAASAEPLDESKQVPYVFGEPGAQQLKACPHCAAGVPMSSQPGTHWTGDTVGLPCTGPACECPARKVLARCVDHIRRGRYGSGNLESEARAVLITPCPCEGLRFDISDGRNRYRPCPSCKATSGMGLSGAGGTGVACLNCGFAGPRISGSPAAWKDKWAFDSWNDIEREPEAVAERDSLRARVADLEAADLHAAYATHDFLARIADLTAEVTASLERERKAMERLESATEFDLGHAGRVMNGGTYRTQLHIRKCFGHLLPKEPMWKVIDETGVVLCKDGEWEYEPTPSSRDADFYARARFDTYEDAKRAASALATPEGTK